MKQFRLFLLSLLALGGLITSADAHDTPSSANETALPVQTTCFVVKEYRPTVNLIGASSHGSGYDCVAAERDVVDDYIETGRRGFQQSHNPQFIFATHDNRFSLALGGMVNLRTSYDFKGAMGNIDFVPYDIPMSHGYANRQRIMMDASTSRLFIKAIINSSALGRVVVYSDMDFRGGREFSYTPRLRTAYVQFLGLTLGRDVTTFCDLEAAPTTIDFQGPNAYNFNFNTMIRYEHSFIGNHLTVGVAAEMPSVDATYGEHFSAIYQRVPDGIAYVQYAWGEGRSSHIRASGVVRDMYLHDNTLGKNTTQLGWGVQLSGHIDLGRWVELFMNGVYGRGITPYIQELTGTPYDFTYNPHNPHQLQTLPMWGWQAAAQLNIIPGVFWLSGGYSEVRLEEHDGRLSDSQYHRSDYIFGNAFCNITPNLTIAVEYLHGSREDMGGSKRHANRLSLMAQYNF